MDGLRNGDPLTVTPTVPVHLSSGCGITFASADRVEASAPADINCAIISGRQLKSTTKQRLASSSACGIIVLVVVVVGGVAAASVVIGSSSGNAISN